MPHAKLTFLTPGFAVGPTPTTKTVRLIKTIGFSTIINLMPEGTPATDPIYGGLIRRIKKLGFSYRHLGANGVNRFDDRVVERMQVVLSEAPGAVFAFSGNGQRATALWAMAMRDRMDQDDILRAAQRAGHDISFLFEMVAPPYQQAA